MSYTHLTEVERYDIYEQKREGLTLTEIAKRLRRSRSTISRELRRNSGRKGYRPRQAQQNAEARLMTQRGGLHIYPRSWKRCHVLLERGYSPARASGRLRRDDFAPISRETICKRICEGKSFGGSIWRNLRCSKKRRKRYASGRQSRGRIPNRIGIEKRCPRVDARSSAGHWEGDTVIGRNRKYVFVTLVERRTGYGIVRKVKTRNADGIATAIIDALGPLKTLVRTLTLDNGLEFAKHEAITAALGVKIFFADPYSSWQCGTNENWNGLLRQYFTKRSCFARLSEFLCTRRGD